MHPFNNPGSPDQSLSGGGYGAQIGDINSLLQGITQHGYFKTSPLTLQMLQNYLQGNEQRAVGQAGSLAGGYASARGFNPYAYAQHATANVYNDYADKFAQLPMLAFQSQLSANHQNLGNILDLLAQRASGLSGQFQQEQSGFNLGRDLVPGLLAAGGKIGAAAISDRRLKKNIHALGETPPGIPIYSFEYLWGGEYIGVMADEVEGIIPEAVITLPSGYKMVDYSMLR
jgi:hypothetical protein